MLNDNFENAPSPCYAWELVTGQAIVYIELAVGRVTFDGDLYNKLNMNRILLDTPQGETVVQLLPSAECLVWWKDGKRHIEVEGCKSC